jgi:hypothetical protein
MQPAQVTVKMDAAGSSEKPVIAYEIVRIRNPEDRHLDSHHSEKHQSRMGKFRLL